MFYKCKRLKNIDGLKYLDTKDVNNFSHMFEYCEDCGYLDLKALQNWNVSNGKNFKICFGVVEQ